MTDQAGALTFTQSYDPYGVVTYTDGTSQTDYGFTGEQYGDTTGLLYLRARYYNPADGRFQSRDTWSGDYNRPLSLNRWVYTEGNPVNAVDPSGNAPCIPDADHKCPSQWPSTPYQRFDKTLNYMYNEMINNYQGDAATLIKSMLENGCFNYPLPYNAQLSAYLNFFSLTRPHGEWDHKPKLKSMLNIGSFWADPYFPIRGDDSYEYYYDIWSNIHFGFVGAAIGFPESALIDLPDLGRRYPILKPMLGDNGPGDIISVQIGIDLWKIYNNRLTKEQLITAILNQTNKYLAIQDSLGNSNGVLDKQPEIDSNVGPLLPRGWERYGELAGDWK